MFSFITHIAWQTAQAIIALSLLLPFILHSVFYLQKKRQKQTSVSEELFEEKDFAIIVSVSHSGEKINRVIDSLLQLQYTNYLVYIVTNKNINPRFYTDDERIVWLTSSEFVKQPFRLRQYAIDSFKRSHTHAVVLDENCIADADFLNGLNVCFHQGFQVVQSMITTKTISGFTSQLYALRNAYNRFFYNYVLFELGSSATVNNNGVAFTVSFYKTYLQSLNTMTAGIADSVQTMLAQQNFQVAFAKNAIIVEENASDAQPDEMRSLQTINVQIQKLWNNSQLLFKGIICFDRNLFLSGLQLLQLPLFASLFLAIFCLIINACFNPFLAIFWMIGLGLFSISFLSIAHWGTNKRKPSSTTGSVLTGLQSLYKESEVEMYSAAQSF